jgi:hypothetical protein
VVGGRERAVTDVHRRLTSATETPGIARELKTAATAETGSCWRVDRRRA